MPSMEAVDIDELSLRRADKRYSEACKRVAEMSGASTVEKLAVLREAAKGHPFQLHYSLHGQLVLLNPWTTAQARAVLEQLDSGSPGPAGTPGIGIPSLRFLGYARGRRGREP